MLHLRVLDEHDAEIGQRFLAVHKLQAGLQSIGYVFELWAIGYRHITLRNRFNRSESPASLFVRIDTRVQSPAYQRALRERYANPLKALKEQEEARQAFANPMSRSSLSKRPTSTAAATSAVGESSSTPKAATISTQT